MQNVRKRPVLTQNQSGQSMPIRDQANTTHCADLIKAQKTCKNELCSASQGQVVLYLVVGVKKNMSLLKLLCIVLQCSNRHKQANIEIGGKPRIPVIGWHI